MQDETIEALLQSRTYLPITCIKTTADEAVDDFGIKKNYYVEFYNNKPYYYFFDEKGTMANLDEIILKSIILNTDAIKTIKKCAIYFTTISIISIIVIIIYLISLML